MDKLQLLNDHQLPFAKVLGLKIIAVSETGVKAEMVVRPELCTRPDILHGGAVMAFADTLGAAEFLRGGECRFAVIEAREERSFAQRAEALGVRYSAGPRIDAINISNGRPITIAVFRSTGSS